MGKFGGKGTEKDTGFGGMEHCLIYLRVLEITPLGRAGSYRTAPCVTHHFT